MKITELHLLPENKCGKLLKNGVILEAHEENTAKFLTLYGFKINAIRPLNIPKMKNPDFLIDGAIWEMKAPSTSNLKTIKKRMHNASEQVGRIVIDLRSVGKNYKKVESDIVKRFTSKSVFRAMILITKDGRVFYYNK